ncbi:hypothetical protein A2U01_0106808, partial [Trifolium medium]|nr:hypothetical protein [Trifolium medium]
VPLWQHDDLTPSRKTQDAGQMTWPMERPFYPEEVRQGAVGSKEVIHGSEEESDN